MTDRNLAIIEALRKQTQEFKKMPIAELKEWFRKVHGPGTRELEGEEAEQMLIVLKLIGHYTDTNNQRTHTYYYMHNGKKYMVTYGLGDDPLIEEELTDDL